MGAKDVARQLAATFLQRGNFVLAGTSSSAMVSAVAPASSLADGLQYVEELGFSGLAVQSVGYEEGNNDPKVHIYVIKGRVTDREIETPSGKNIPIILSRVGKVMVRPDAAMAATARGKLYKRGNRIACGSSCAPSGEHYAGTLGALVRKAGDSSIYGLSNNHVFAACNHTEVGMPILCPSPMDAAANVPAPSEICRHSQICELRSGVPTLVPPARDDIAIGRVVDPKSVSSWQGDDAAGYDTPTAVTPPTSGLRVKKFGRTTGLTLGVVESHELPFAMPYRARLFNATVWVTDVWTVLGDKGPFALPGDSGSLVVCEDGSGSVGLLFAAGGDYGYIIPMSYVVSKFGGLTILGAHGV